MSTTRTSFCEDQSPILSVNYNWSADEVLRKSAEYFVRREDSLDALFLAQFYRDPQDKGASWVPSWPLVDRGSMNLREICHVQLLDKYSRDTSYEFDSTNWPRVISAETVDTWSQKQFDDYCSFEGDSLQVEDHLSGAIKVREGTSGERKLVFEALNEHFLKSTGNICGSLPSLSHACSDHAPLHVKQLASDLITFLERVKCEADSRQFSRLQNKVDRLCVASAPVTAEEGDFIYVLRASSVFVVLRRFELKDGTCRARFVVIAFFSQDLFNMSMLADVEEKTRSNEPNKIWREAQNDSIVFKEIIRKAPNRVTDSASDNMSEGSSTTFSLPLTPEFLAPYDARAFGLAGLFLPRP